MEEPSFPFGGLLQRKTLSLKKGGINEMIEVDLPWKGGGRRPLVEKKDFRVEILEYGPEGPPSRLWGSMIKGGAYALKDGSPAPPPKSSWGEQPFS